MDDALGVRRIESVGYLDSHVEQTIQIQRFPESQFPKRLAFQVLHRDEWARFVLANLVDRANIRMVQRRRGPCFPPETLECQRIAGDVIGKKLQRNKAAKLGVFGLVNHTHSATAQLTDDTVVRNGLAERRWRRHGCASS